MLETCLIISVFHKTETEAASMGSNSFFEDFTRNVTGQFDQCQGYRLLCQTQGYDPYKHLKTETDVDKVPFVVTTLFKKSNALYQQLLRVNCGNLAKWTISSSTSGDPSIVGRTESDLKQLQEIVERDENIFRPKYGYDCVFFPEPTVMRLFHSENLYGKPTESYIGNLLSIFKFSDETIFLLKEQGDEFIVDTDAFLSFLKRHDGKNDRISIRGSTLLFFNTIQQLKSTIPPFHLGRNAIIHTGGGGWDGHKGNISMGRIINRSSFVNEISAFLGIPTCNFIDTYSFTENSTPITGHYSEKYNDYLFHIPSWGRVLIRDVKTLSILNKEGDKGFIEVLNAYGTSAFAGASVLVDDLGEIISTEKCPECKKDGMTIRILGRVTGAEAKGCGATLKVGRNAS